MSHLLVLFHQVDGKPVPKGIAFPTSVSINNNICHVSPLKSEEPIILKKDDVVKM